MIPGRLAFTAVSVLTAVLLQSTVVERLPLPGAGPDLLLVVVVAFALVEGQGWGMGTGFAAGLLADLGADHQLGRLALAYVVVGYLAGALSGDLGRSRLLPFWVVALGGAAALVLFAGAGILLGDPRVTAGAFGRALVSSVPYSVVLAPLVVRAVAGALRRLDPVRDVDRLRVGVRW